MTADQLFIPFSVRSGARSGEAVGLLHKGIPGHMRPSLQQWVVSAMRNLSLDGYLQRRLQIDVAARGARSVYDAASKDDVLLLDIVDTILQMLPGLDEAASEYHVRELLGSMLVEMDEMLTQSSSAYAVDYSDGCRLTTRVDSTAEQAFTDAVTQTQQASGLLRSAWSATFKRDPDPTVAYRDAVLAVESVACEAFIPNDQRPSLGKAINHLRDTIADWNVATLDDQQQASAATLLAMLRTVWQNHQRHVGEGGTPPEPASQEEAEAVLFLAVTIVQWFERGLVKRG